LNLSPLVTEMAARIRRLERRQARAKRRASPWGRAFLLLALASFALPQPFCLGTLAMSVAFYVVGGRRYTWVRAYGRALDRAYAMMQTLLGVQEMQDDERTDRRRESDPRWS